MTDTTHSLDLRLDDDDGERPVVTRRPPQRPPLFQPLSSTVQFPPGPVPDVQDALPDPVPSTLFVGPLGRRMRSWTRSRTRTWTGAVTWSPPWMKSRVVAGLLGVFLGGLGLHRMYLGHWRRGLTMLAITVVGGFFTFGVAAAVVGLWGFTEGLVILAVRRGRFAHDARGRQLRG